MDMVGALEADTKGSMTDMGSLEARCLEMEAGPPSHKTYLAANDAMIRNSACTHHGVCKWKMRS